MTRAARALGGAAVLAAAALPAASCAQAPASEEERGRRVFARVCAGCHGSEGRGGAVPVGGAAPRDLTDPALQARLDDVALRRVIREGSGAMPPLGPHLADEEVAAVVRYLRTLTPPR